MEATKAQDKKEYVLVDSLSYLSTTSFRLGILTIVLTDAFLFVFLMLIKEKYESIMLELSILVLTLCVVAHMGATWTATRSAEVEAHNIFIMVSSVCFGFMPVSVAVHMVAASMTSGAVDALYSTKSNAPNITQSYGKARVFREKGQLKEALEQYWKYFYENPKNPAPLFAAVTMFLADGKVDDAEEILRSVMDHFEKDNAVWCDAAFQLANITETQKQDKKAANALMRSIVKRSPHSELGHLAGARLLKDQEKIPSRRWS